jgi:hypothetical protein
MTLGQDRLVPQEPRLLVQSIRSCCQPAKALIEGPLIRVPGGFVGKPHFTLQRLTPTPSDRTASASPHAFGVDEIVHTLWLSPKVAAFRCNRCQHNFALGGSTS